MVDGSDEAEQLTTDWMPGLRQCAGLAVVRGLTKWHIMVQRMVEEENGDVWEEAVEREELIDWDETRDDWAAFEREVALAGVQLTFGMAVGH